MLNDARTWPRIAQVIGKSAQNDVHQLLITDVQTTGHGDYVVTVELPPSGFTREDVTVLHRIAEAASGDGVSDPIEFIDTMLVVGDGARLRSLMSRIEALLPPE